MTVTRWKKYGHERLYVSTENGQRVGWIDLKTGATTLEHPELALPFDAAIASFLAGDPVAAVPPPPAADAASPAIDLSTLPPPLARQTAPPPPPAPGLNDPPPVSTEPTWVDLAANRPGQGIRAEAEAERAANWERSRIRSVINRVADTNTQERRWRVGAKGEEVVGARLDRLVERGWKVLHSVPIGLGNTDIDHVLIGAGGVYTVNTKNRPDGEVVVDRDMIRVNGRRTTYLPASRSEGAKASRFLSDAVGWPVEARPVLVILTGTLFPSVTYRHPADGVIVLDRMDVPGWFKKTRPRFTPEQVDDLFELARRDTTWRRR